MLASPTMEKLRELRLLGMAKAWEEQLSSSQYAKLSFEERLGHLVEREHTERENRRLSSRLHKAKLRHHACLEDINFSHTRGLDRTLVLTLAKCRWVKDHRNLLITGPTGVGKSFIACALAHKACLEGYTALYIRSPRLLADLAVARGDGRYPKVMQGLAKIDVLVIDDWGLSKLGDQDKRELLEIMEDRHGLRSTVITSQIPVKKWHELIGDSTIADAFLDRLVHNAYRMDLDGDSLRKKENTLGEGEKDYNKGNKK